MKPHAGQALESDVLLLHDDGSRQSAEAKTVCDNPGVEAVGLIQIRISVSELADELWIDGKDFSFAFLECQIFVHVHGGVPAIDRSRFKANVDLGR
ncbi:hypothetical protein D3C81_1115160 [compost metagenome]